MHLGLWCALLPGGHRVTADLNMLILHFACSCVLVDTNWCYKTSFSDFLMKKPIWKISWITSKALLLQELPFFFLNKNICNTILSTLDQMLLFNAWSERFSTGQLLTFLRLIMSTLYVVIKSLLAYMQGQRDVHVRGEKKRIWTVTKYVIHTSVGKVTGVKAKGFWKKNNFIILKKMVCFLNRFQSVNSNIF